MNIRILGKILYVQPLLKFIEYRESHQVGGFTACIYHMNIGTIPSFALRAQITPPPYFDFFKNKGRRFFSSFV